MPKEMLINVSEGEECRIALLDDGKLEELYMERTSSTSHVGNIYKGKVTNVEPSIQAAFVDFGLGRNGFLHISDLMPSYFGRAGSDIQESVGKKMARRDRPPIQRCLRRGDEIIVQIIKEGIGTKGPTLSTYLSIPGRILVMMPGMGKMGVSKKIEDEEERRRLRTILDSLKPPKGVGFIIRTAGIGKSKAEIQRDLTYLSRLWQQIEKKRQSSKGPTELYTEGDLVARTVRDVFASDIERLIVDSKDVAKRVKEVIKITSPRTRNKVETYEEPIPLFHKYGIEKDIEQMYSRHVPLPSGGSLVIDSTEAIVAIDVNSGKFRDHSDAETTAFKTDMEAADEIPRQLKLRDLGGVIICDFIDLRYERHRRELEERLHENFKRDRAKTKVLRMSQFGIIEITRQRMRPSLKRSIYFDCPHCKGAGLVKTPESMSLDVMRKLAMAAHHERVSRVELSVCPDVSFYLLNKKRRSLAALEAETRKRLVVRPDVSLGLDEMKFDLFDARDSLVVLEELGLGAQPPHTSQLHTRPAGQKGRRGGRGRDRGRGRDQRGYEGAPPPRHEEEHEFDAEEAIDEREERRERTPADDALAASIAPKIVHQEEPQVPEHVDDERDEAPADEHIEEPQVEEEENVVDVDDGPSELGERPSGEWERRDDRNRDGGGGHRRRGRRGGRGRGREGQGGYSQGGAQGGGQGGRQGGGQGGGQGGQRRDNRQQYQQNQNRGPQPQRGPQNQRSQQEINGNVLPPPEPDFEEEEQEGPSPGNELAPSKGGGRPDQKPAVQGFKPGYRHGQGKGQGVAQRQGDAQRQGGGQGQGGAQGQSGGPGQGDGKRRRRRRGGRRHRRRRERERLAREQAAAAGIPYVPPPRRDDDDEYEDEPRDEGQRQPQPDVDRASEPEPAPEPEAQLAPAPEPIEEVEEAPAEEPDEEAAPSRKKRGGRKPAAGAKTSRTRSASKRKAPTKSAESRTASQSDEAPVVKTGSADKHLADDEPAEHAPVSRPRRRYDLDAIPDDYD